MAPKKVGVFHFGGIKHTPKETATSFSPLNLSIGEKVSPKTLAKVEILAQNIDQDFLHPGEFLGP